MSIFLWIFLFSNVFATTYYISNSGDNKNNGLSPVYPWKTIQKLNTILPDLKPGDMVLFERNGYFTGQINLSVSGSESNPIIFGAYGDGNYPIISGAIPVKDWTKYKNNIYQSQINSKVNNLFVNGEQMIIARYPNTGFLYIKKPYANSKQGFYDDHLKQPSGYWDGSNVRIRTENWVYEYSDISKFKKGTVTLKNHTKFPIQSNWGYYLDNNLNELDYDNEWYFKEKDKNSGTIYLQLNKYRDIENTIIEATVYEYGIFSRFDISNIVIQDLAIKNQYKSGIWLAGKKSNITVQNCTFKGQYRTGLYFSENTINCKINNCRFFDINGKAIFVLDSKNLTISNNLFRNIGMIPGYGATSDDYTMSCIVVFTDQSVISGNNIGNVGHDAINCPGKNNVVEKNVIKDCLLYLNDGGGIKCYGENSTNSTWNNNFIFNIRGNIESTDKKNNGILALGIYLDQLTNNLSIKNNTLVNCGTAGVGMNAGVGNTIENNICYNNFSGLFFYQDNVLARNNVLQENQIIGINNNQYSVLIRSLGINNVPGKFDNNYYLNSGNYKSFNITHLNISSNFNFEEWKSFTNSDKKSIIDVDKNVEYTKLITNMSDDTLKVLLDQNMNSKNLQGNNIYGALEIDPWSSEIIRLYSNYKNFPELNIAGKNLEFGNKDSQNSNLILWYNIIANNLSEKVIISAPEGFEISLSDGIGFTDFLNLIPDNGSIDKIIYVRFVPDSEKGYYGYISNKCGNLSSKIKVRGNSK